LSVIAWVGVRNYYNKIGYKLEGTYMVKELKKGKPRGKRRDGQKQSIMVPISRQVYKKE